MNNLIILRKKKDLIHKELHKLDDKQDELWDKIHIINLKIATLNGAL